MSADIVRLSELSNQSQAQIELREIFFEASTKKDFESDKIREAFFEKYLGYYIRTHPELIWVAKSDRILGYITLSLTSDDTELLQLQPHLEIFKAQFRNYPAHIHINLHHESRGMGLGSKLMKTVMQYLKSLNISGLHIMTGTESSNREFYKKLGFDFELALDFKGATILLMGRKIIL